MTIAGALVLGRVGAAGLLGDLLWEVVTAALVLPWPMLAMRKQRMDEARMRAGAAALGRPGDCGGKRRCGWGRRAGAAKWPPAAHR